MIRRGTRTAVAIFIFFIFLSGWAWAGEVKGDRARAAAQNWLAHCVQVYGGWAGVKDPQIIGEEPVLYQGQVVGYNFLVSPRGHILVPARDELPPVKLYSDTSTLTMTGATVLKEQAAWISEELYKITEAIQGNQVEFAKAEFAKADMTQTVNYRLWSLFGQAGKEFAQEHTQYAVDKGEFLTLGPLLGTTWGQGSPYNQYCPLWYTGGRTLTGCVATAAAQIMRYWNWPVTGSGKTSYTWNDGAKNWTLSVNCAAYSPDWANMPSSISSGSNAAHKEAIADLMVVVGYAFHMNYGISASGASTLDGASVFPTYFGYKNTAKAVSRSNYGSDGAWMKVFKSEIENRRPAQLRLRDTKKNGHSVVVDGYRDAPEQIHLNLGWSGSYDAWYASNSIVTGGTNWSDASYQAAVIGIEGQAPPPTTTTIPPSDPGGGGGGGCFIATAAYGSYLDPHVQVLRHFRDDHLLTNGPGRGFVQAYYQYSPSVAAFIKDHEILRMATRVLLTPVVFAVKYPLGLLGFCGLALVAVGGVYRTRRRDPRT